MLCRHNTLRTQLQESPRITQQLCLIREQVWHLCAGETDVESCMSVWQLLKIMSLADITCLLLSDPAIKAAVTEAWSVHGTAATDKCH